MLLMEKVYFCDKNLSHICPMSVLFVSRHIRTFILLMPIMTSAGDTAKLSWKLCWAMRECCARHPHRLHREGRLVWRLFCHPSPRVYCPLFRGMWASGLYSCFEGRKHVVGSVMTRKTISASNCVCVKENYTSLTLCHKHRGFSFLTST